MPSSRVSPDAKPAAADPNFMESLARGLAVLRAFSTATPVVSTAEAARITGMSRAATRRCLYTLQKLGYATGKNGTYALTPQVLALGYAYLASAPLARVAQPILERLSERLHESCSLAVLDGDDILYVARSATSRIISVGLTVGSRLPAYCTSMGRVLLASMSDKDLAAYLERVRLVPHTPHTLHTRAALRGELRGVRQRGYAVVDQELELGLRSIAVPVLGRDRSIVAAVNSGAHASRVQVRTLTRDYLPLIQEAAAELSEALAHRSV
jgi:IclR family transcriptional regulator, pca regulon regulatory protein